MLDAVPQHLVLRDIGEVGSMSPDLIVEVAHPSVVTEYGQTFLQTADFMVSISLYPISIKTKCLYGMVYIMYGVKAERIWKRKHFSSWCVRGKIKEALQNTHILLSARLLSVLPQVGSPTALAEAAMERNLVREARDGAHGLYVPAGAFWGGQDIQKMADRGTLRVRALLEIDP